MMSDDRLTGLFLLHVHQDITIHIDNVIDRFSKTRNGRLDLLL